jgi:ABC-type uncharacterized transport system permease subunit
MQFHGEQGGDTLALLGLGAMWAPIAEWFWRQSLRRYTSAST